MTDEKNIFSSSKFSWRKIYENHVCSECYFICFYMTYAIAVAFIALHCLIINQSCLLNYSFITTFSRHLELPFAYVGINIEVF